MEAPETIVCVDCGGVCHLLTVMDRGPGFDDAGDPDGGAMVIAAYRCEDCLDRWDVELELDDAEPDPHDD